MRECPYGPDPKDQQRCEKDRDKYTNICYEAKYSDIEGSICIRFRNLSGFYHCNGLGDRTKP